MPIQDDFSVAVNGDIRYTGTTVNYTVIAFHRWLGDLMDDAQAVGNDLLDITGATASDRATDNLVTLNSPFNIDDIAARHLYDGSIVQGASGAEIYDGILVLAPASTYVSVIQNGKIVTPNFWTTALNADAPNGISHKFLMRVRTGGADIDGRRLIVQNREFGNNYSEFKINGTARGNNVAALSAATDLNNTTAAATVKGWTGITNTEGYRTLNVDNIAPNEAYYSEWNKDTFTINQLFERTKWLSRRATAESTGSDTGTAFQLANATIIGQSQSFANGVVPVFVTRAFFNIRKVGSPTGNLVVKIYAHSGTFGSSSIPTGAALATSVNVDGAKLTTVYQTVEFGFDTQVLLSASTNYVVSVERAVIDASNYFEIEGLATSGTHVGNRSQLVTATWTPTAGDDLNFRVDTSPQLYELTGEMFRGITHEVIVDTPTGTFQAVEPISWSGGTGQLIAQVFPDTTVTALSVNGSLQFARAAGSFITDGFLPGQTIISSGFTNAGNNTTKVISTVTATLITVTVTTGLVAEGAGIDERIRAGHLWMQLLTGVAPTDNQTITGGQSSATCLMNVTITERTLSFPYFGASTGTAMIGAYGVGVETADLSASDKLFDLTNTQRIPPNNVTFTVSGLVIGEDRVLVGPESAGALQTAQMTLATTLSGGTETAVVVTTTIPSDTPSSGTIRIQLDSGIYRRVAYTSFTGSTFTIGSTSFVADPATQPKNVFISYLDLLATATSHNFVYVFNATRSHFIRVRDGAGTPIKTFEGIASMGSAGGSISAIRTTDA